MNSQSGAAKTAGVAIAAILTVCVGAAVIHKRMNARPSFPIVCDITQIAAQTPEYVQQYFDRTFQGQRTHTNFTENAWIDEEKNVTLTHLVYPLPPTNPDERQDQMPPYADVTFSHGRAIEATVVFKQRQSVRETARRVGLDLAALRYRGTTFHGYQRHYSGTFQGVKIEDVLLTNPAEESDAPRIVDVTFARPGAAASKSAAI